MDVSTTVFGWLSDSVSAVVDWWTNTYTSTGFALPFIIAFTIFIIYRFLLAPIFSGSDRGGKGKKEEK